MALTLASSLTLHQRGNHKRPSLAATISQTHFGIPTFLAAEAVSDTAEPSAPVALAVDAAGAFYVARNNAGDLDFSSDFASWANVDTVTAGQGFALAYDPVAAAVLLAYGDGNDLKLRTSADAFASPTTLVTEASPIGAVALAVRPSNGNACAFYAIGTTSTVKRLRRTSGTWAGSGTTWSRTASADTITGLSARWDDDFYLAITGTEATTTHEKLWAAAMGDTSLPANAWSSLVTITEADAAASCSFAYPSLTQHPSGVFFLLFQQQEAGNVAASRVMLTHTTEFGTPNGFWREPYPYYPIPTSHGAALAYTSGGFFTGFIVAAPANAYISPLYGSHTLTPRVLSCSWRETPTSCKLRLELDDHDGDALSTSGGLAPVAPGLDLTVTHGFHSGTAGAIQTGVVLRLPIVRIVRRFQPGKATVLIEAEGPWEHLARYRAPQAWTAPSGYTRGNIFSRLAARAGIEVNQAAGARAPGATWTADTPAFAVAAGERGNTTLERLIEPTPEMLRIAGTTGAFEVCGGFLTSEAPGPAERYTLPVQSIAVGDHPLLTMESVQELAPDWVRLQGPDRYADAFAWDADRVAPGAAYPAVVMDHVRDLDASDDTAATAAAESALLRRQLLTPIGRLTAPADLGRELYDPVQAEILANGYTHQLNGSEAVRIIARGIDYKAGKAGAEFTSTLTFGRV